MSLWGLVSLKPQQWGPTDPLSIAVYCIALGYIPDRSACLLFYEIDEVSIQSDQQFSSVIVLKCAFSTIAATVFVGVMSFVCSLSFCVLVNIDFH